MNLDFETRERFDRVLRAALAQFVEYSPRPIDSSGEADLPAAVLILLAWENSEPWLLLTKRTELVETHKGQFAFPGGKVEPNDLDARAAALRETEEEVGIPAEAVRSIGELPPLRTPSGYRVIPVVGVLTRTIAEAPLRLAPEETEEAFWVSLRDFAKNGVYRTEQYQTGGQSFLVHIYQIGHRKIWGVTGAMLKNLLDRLSGVG